MIKFRGTWYLLEEGDVRDARRPPTEEEQNAYALANPAPAPKPKPEKKPKKPKVDIKAKRRRSIRIESDSSDESISESDSGSSSDEVQPEAPVLRQVPSDVIKSETERALRFLLNGGHANPKMLQQILRLFCTTYNHTKHHREILPPVFFKADHRLHFDSAASATNSKKKKSVALHIRNRRRRSSSSSESSGSGGSGDDIVVTSGPTKTQGRDQELSDAWNYVLLALRFAQQHRVELKVLKDKDSQQTARDRRPTKLDLKEVTLHYTTLHYTTLHATMVTKTMYRVMCCFSLGQRVR